MSDLAREQIRPVSRHGTQAVWMLTVVGISTVAIVLATSFWSLKCIRNARVASDELRAEVTLISNRSDRILEEFSLDSSRLLTDPLKDSTGELWHDMPSHFRLLQTESQIVDQRIAGTVHDVVSFIQEGKRLDAACLSMANRRRHIRQQRRHSAGQSAAAIRRLKAILQSDEGARMLELVRDFRAYQRLDGEPANQAARTFLKQWSPHFVQSEVARELDDLALLHQRLLTETNPDALIDLRDNRIKPHFDRLRRFLNSHANHVTQDEVETVLSSVDPPSVDRVDPEFPYNALWHLESAFFGSGFQYDPGRQSVALGEGGFYEHCVRWLDTEAERQLLKSKRADYLARYTGVKERLLKDSARIHRESTEQATKLVARASNMILIIGLISAIAFLFLARRVANTIASQITVLSQQSIELAIAKAEAEKLSLVAKYTANSVVITDAKAKIEWVNEGFTRITGYTLAEVKGLVPGHFLQGPDTDPKTIEFIRKAFRAREGFDVELLNYHKDGSPYWIELEVRPIVERNNQLAYFMAIVSDITRRKDAERAKEELASELQMSARQAGMAEIAADVLHNVGNALNSINVSVHTLRDQLDCPAYKHLSEASKLISKQQENLGEFLLNDPRGQHFPSFLDQLASAVTAGRNSQLSEVVGLMQKIDHVKEIVACQRAFSLHRSLSEPVSPIAVVEEAVNMNISSLERHGVHLERDFETGCDVLLERHSIIQVMINLIKNAKESVVAADPETPCIRLMIKYQLEEIVFVVRDNGTGISKENLVEIFRHGFTTKATGHGFGLHSSANVAQEMGGSLSVESEGTGRGATFTLRVPIQQIATINA